MKREIKFRAWDKAENKWLFGYEYPNLGGFSLIGEVVLLGELSSLPLDKLFNDVEITQFTGLKDKNGKEIYEGDIITNEAITFDVEKNKTRYWIVDFDKGCFSSHKLAIRAMKGIEVIGNIFENPELL